MSPCAYLFLDEAGNFDFSNGGTRYFVLTSVAIRRPFPFNEPLDSYRYDLLESGRNQEFFHCAEDNAWVRGKVFDLISTHLGQMRIDSLIVEKSKTGPALREDQRFYPEMLGHLLKYVLKGLSLSAEENVIVITDQIPVNRKRNAIEKAVKSTLNEMLPVGNKYQLHHHISRSHYGLQVADYCNWAIFRKWERGDTAAYNKIRPAIRSEFEIFRSGMMRYY